MKINCIIQARMGSTRLPGKVMADIAGKPMIQWIYEACQRATVPDQVVFAIAAPPFPSQGTAWTRVGGLLAWVKKNDCKYVNLHENDLASRFLAVLSKYPCDGFVRVCADSPLVEPEVIDEAAHKIRDGLDYYPAGWIDGNQAEGFNTKAFIAAEPSMRGEEREHLGLWFRRRMRLTVDDEGDLERIRWLISQRS